MNKYACGLRLKTDKGLIYIYNDCEHEEGEESGVMVSPDQVPQLIEWLKEAQAAAQEEESSPSASSGA